MGYVGSGTVSREPGTNIRVPIIVTDAEYSWQ